MIKIAPSILSADFINIKNEIKSIETSGADLVHLDIMDGHFVPNITFGPFIIKQFRKLTDLPFDAHLMIENPTNYIKDFKDAGCNMITVHLETEKHLHRTLQLIKSLGIKSGVSINPHSSIEFLKYVGDLVDILLIMTVNPGFGGQKYIKKAGEKIKEAVVLRKKLNLNFEVSVDGGVNKETFQEIKNLGADILITGSFFFGTKLENRRELIFNMKNK